MNVINVSQRTPEWAAWRAGGVTASEAPVILERSPYKTPWRLWAERTGAAPAEDLSTKPCVQRGIALEDEARQSFEERHGTLLLPLCVQSDEHPILRASLDGLSTEDEPVELKVPTERTYQLVAAQGEQALAYQLYWVQLQFQILVTGAERGWLVFDPCRTSTPALEFVIERDENFLRQELIPACLAFWEAIRTEKAPPLDAKRDLYVPTEDALTQWTQAASEYRELAAKRKELESKLKAVKTAQDHLEGDFVTAMGEFLLADAEGVRVTRYLQNGSVDYTALLKEIAPDLEEVTLNQYRRPGTERVKVTLSDETAAPASRPAPAAAHFYF